jgi:hypothetical protein
MLVCGSAGGIMAPLTVPLGGENVVIRPAPKEGSVAEVLRFRPYRLSVSVFRHMTQEHPPRFPAFIACRLGIFEGLVKRWAIPSREA